MKQTAKKCFIRFVSIGMNLANCGNAVSIHKFMNCIVSHNLVPSAFCRPNMTKGPGDEVAYRIICSTKPIDAMFLRRLLAFAEKIWNETNLQEVAQDWMF